MLKMKLIYVFHRFCFNSLVINDMVKVKASPKLLIFPAERRLLILWVNLHFSLAVPDSPLFDYY